MTWEQALEAAAARMMAPPNAAPTGEHMRWAALAARETAERITVCLRIVRHAADELERAEKLELPQLYGTIAEGRDAAADRLGELHHEAALIHRCLAEHRPELARRVPQLQLPIVPADADAIIAGLLLVHREAQIPEAT
jgi:hypothetical protein